MTIERIVEHSADVRPDQGGIQVAVDRHVGDESEDNSAPKPRPDEVARVCSANLRGPKASLRSKLAWPREPSEHCRFPRRLAWADVRSDGA